MNKLSSYAPVVVRIGMSLVFLWFGIDQLLNPEMWTRVVPEWAGSAFGSAETVILINGWLETILGFLLLAGIQVRIVSLILALNLIPIASSFGWAPTGIRDFGLAIATFSIFLNGADRLCLGRRFKGNSDPIVSNQQ